MESYIIFWKKEKINRIIGNGDKGPLTVLYGGPHQSQPAFGRVSAGDKVYPITVIDGKLYLIGRMTIDSIVDAEGYLSSVLKIINPDHMWDIYWDKHKNEVTHKIPNTCADNAAVGSNGTGLSLREVPSDIASEIKVGPKSGQEKPLRSQNGKISTSGMIGYYRRLSFDSAALLDRVIGVE